MFNKHIKANVVKTYLTHILFVLLVLLNSASADTQLIVDENASIEEYSFSVNADLDDDTEYDFNHNALSTIAAQHFVSLPALKRQHAYSLSFSTQSIRAPPNFRS